MSEGSLDRLEELLAELLDRPPEERGSFLDQACGDDAALRREAEELLGLDDQAAGFFEKLSSDIAAAAPLELDNADRPRIQIGPYRALEAIGHGGMGVVYRAERVDGAFDQKVALKLLHRDMDTPQLRARFLAERQLLARLSHPNIARLADGGVTEEGRPYFVMEHVKGLPITQYCRDNGLPLEQVLRLFLVVIDAVSYLHRNLVVHRDLKPGNIFVGQDGQVKLLDFGIAKLLADVPEAASQTRTGERLMTPEYAAPEQLLGAPVTTATDVYALGVVLYELLTGRRPHDRATSDPGSVSRDLPPTPSSMLRSRRKKAQATPATQPGAGPSPEAAVAWRRIPRDLDTICLTSLRPEPEARYPSAEQFGQDIERYLEGLPVRARTSTLGYRALKFAQRHRGGIAATAGLLALIVAGFARERGLRGEAERARIEAQRQAGKAVAVSEFLGRLLSSVDPMKAQGREVTVAEVLNGAATRLAESKDLADQPSVEAAVRLTIGDTYTALGKYAEARPHLERAVELRGGSQSRDPEALAAAGSLGVLYQRLGLHGKAETILRRVLEARSETLGEAHPTTLTAMNHLADLLWAQGRHDEVEAIDRKTLEIRRRVLGEDHPDTLKSLNGLAVTLFTRGRYAEAAQFFEQAYSVARRQLGESHPHTLALGSNLAAAYLELNRYPEAESLLREVVSGKTRVLGVQHEETATSVHNLGVTLAQQARYEEAEEQLRQAIAIREHLAGDKRGYLFSRSLLADTYRDHGRPADAEALYLSTVEEQRARYGPEDAETLKTVSGLAELRLRQGKLRAAEALIARILGPQTKARGEAHPDPLQSLTTLARIRNAQGRYADAQQLCDKAIEAGSKVLGSDHLVVLDLVYERARALVGQQQWDAARQLAARIHEVRARKLGKKHPDTVKAWRLLDGLRRDGGDR